jgi:hypothetical protein
LGEAKRGVVTQMFAKQHAMRAQEVQVGQLHDGVGHSEEGTSMNSLPSRCTARVSYIAYIGGADLALCYVLAREIGTKHWTPP